MVGAKCDKEFALNRDVMKHLTGAAVPAMMRNERLKVGKVGVRVFWMGANGSECLKE